MRSSCDRAMVSGSARASISRWAGAARVMVSAPGGREVAPFGVLPGCCDWARIARTRPRDDSAGPAGACPRLSCPVSGLYAPAMATETPVECVTVGSNAARPFGMDARDRACRLATNAGFECADAMPEGRTVLLASLDYAWDPAWL